MKLLTKQQQQSYENVKICHVCKEKFENKYLKDKKYHELLRQHRMKIINFKKKKMKLLTKEQQESYENTKISYICKEKFEHKYLKDKKYCELLREHEMKIIN